MPDTDFEDGIYVIANFKNPELVIEAKDGKSERHDAHHFE